MNSQQTVKSKSRGRPPKRQTTAAENTTMKCRHLEWSVVNKQELDPCDCPNDGCPGCWYPCEKCGSCKCSPFCRLNRKEQSWQQQYLEWKGAF